MKTRSFSDIQEKELAKFLNGKVQPNSGGTKFSGGDVFTDNFLIEAKTATTCKKSFSIKKEWLEKMVEQAFEQGKYECALAFRFEPFGEDFFIINNEQFKEYLDYKERLYANKE